MLCLCQHPFLCTNIDSVLESGGVFTFGKSRFAENLPNKFWIRNDEVRQVACGDEHTVLLAGEKYIQNYSSAITTNLLPKNISVLLKLSSPLFLLREVSELKACQLQIHPKPYLLQ